MKSLQSLPEGYRQIFSVDLTKNKKTALLLNLASLIVMLTMGIPAHILKLPISSIMFNEDGSYTVVKYLVMFALLIAYIILHELVHGATMKLFGTKKVRYGFKLYCAYAGSDDYYDKKSYIIIALAPVVLWGMVIGIINFFVPDEWFWVVYILQIANISGATGDAYVTAKFSRMPSDILVRDSGVGMTVWSKE